MAQAAAKKAGNLVKFGGGFYAGTRAMHTLPVIARPRRSELRPARRGRQDSCAGQGEQLVDHASRPLDLRALRQVTVCGRHGAEWKSQRGRDASGGAVPEGPVMARGPQGAGWRDCEVV